MPKRPLMPGKTMYCCYCRRGPLIQGEKGGKGSNLTAARDHFVPQRERDGKWVPCCQQCNGLKAALRPSAWLTFIDHNPGYWRTFPHNRIVVRWLIDHNAWRRSQGWRSLPLFDEAPSGFLAFINGA